MNQAFTFKGQGEWTLAVVLVVVRPRLPIDESRHLRTEIPCEDPQVTLREDYISFIRMARETAFPTATLKRFLCLSESNRTRLSLPLSNRSCLLSSRLTLFSRNVRFNILNARPTSPPLTSKDRAVVVVMGAE